MTIANQSLVEQVKGLQEYAIGHRRYLHEHPELTAKEVETSAYLKEEVKALGLEIHEVEGTGFFAVLDTGRPGKTLAMRTDIDALPVQENEHNLKQKRLVCSQVEGVMHACGHDGHMAMLLTTAKILTEIKDQLSGRIVFLFEEGEEMGTGIDAMIRGIEPLGIDAVYGCHLASFMDVGTISIKSGPVMAGAVLVDITVIGKGGHGSRPDLSISPIFAAANIITGLGSAWANQIDVTKTVTMGLGMVNGGTAPNVIPNEVNIKGTMRYFDMEEAKKAVEVVREVSEYTAKAHKCRVEIPEQCNKLGLPVINDEHLAQMARSAVEEIMPGALVEDVTWFASESFSRYRQVAPSLFTFVGIGNPQFGSGAEHHNEYFDMDESALYYGILAEVKFAVDFLQQ